MKRIAIGIANPDEKNSRTFAPAGGANFSWILWILKFIENWYSNIYNFAGNAKLQLLPVARRRLAAREAA